MNELRILLHLETLLHAEDHQQISEKVIVPGMNSEGHQI